MQELQELLCKLISIPSVNPMGRAVSGPEFFETALTEFLEGWLSEAGLEVRRQPVSPARDNLLATYHSPDAKNHILLEVHLDTVPVDGMVIEPFTPKVEGNRIYGRGACDNKGPMTAMLWTMKRLAAESPAGAASVTLALTVDEEFTFTGAKELVRQGLPVQAGIIAEPTDLDIVNAHKGVVRWAVLTPGKACHSSAPTDGISAIYRMARVLTALERYAGELADRTGDLRLGGPTLSVGRIEGGVSVNTVPDSCRIEIDRRLVPGEDPMEAHADVVNYLRFNADLDFEAECQPPWLEAPALGSDRNGRLVRNFAKSIAAFRSGHETRGVSFGTDAAPISQADIPCIVFGPGSVTKAHTKDEWVPLDEIAVAADIYHHFCLHAGQATAIA